MDQPNALALLGRQPIETETIARDLQRAIRDVHPDDLGELSLLEQEFEQSTLTAAKVDDTGCSAPLESGEHCREPLFVETQRSLQCRLRSVACGFCFLDVGLFVADQPRDRIVDEAPPMTQIAARDRVTLGMRR